MTFQIHHTRIEVQTRRCIPARPNRKLPLSRVKLDTYLQLLAVAGLAVATLVGALGAIGCAP